jgi:hypothetical protein
VTRYCAADGVPDKVDAVLAAVREAVHSEDRTYAPILVRFAVNASAEGKSVVGIYDRSLAALVKSRPGKSPADYNVCLAGAAEAACLTARRSYWDEHQRAFRIDRGSESERRMSWAPKQDGILVDAGKALLGVLPGHFVRFLHDSMQTYCAAVALVDDPQFNLAKALRAAAGDPRFLRDGSDLFGYACTEIFGMLVAIAREHELDVDKVLVDDVGRWAAVLDASLPRQSILTALPKSLRDRIATQTAQAGAAEGAPGTDEFGRGMSVEPLVRLASEHATPEERAVVLPALYSVLAPHVWTPEPPGTRIGGINMVCGPRSIRPS